MGAGFFAGVVEDADIGVGGADELLSADEGVSGGEIGIVRIVEKEIAILFVGRVLGSVVIENFAKAAVFQDFEDFATGATD